ncbi:MAG: hypothetical protein HQK51_09315 [Oligoflexia bacterium]|nr:hypothetical protein [Oligoflexia bacterium]
MIKIPYFIVYIYALFAEKYYRLTQTSPAFTRGSIKILKSNLRVNGEKAERELKFKSRNIKISLKDQYKFFKKQGKIQ